MNRKKKPVIAIIFGGCSPEYNVSLQSACSVIRNMDREKYTVVLIGISSQGGWYVFDGAIESIASDTWHDVRHCTPVAISPDRTNPCLLLLKENTVQKLHIDAAFPILHGRNGEDGTVQGLFELAGIPIIGCGTLSSALCMDKDRAHKLVKSAGIDVPDSFTLTDIDNLPLILQQAHSIGYPLFVKPVKAGSSYGITKVSSPDKLPSAIASAKQYDSAILIEACISGFEVGCAIVGNDKLITGEVDEIELSEGFFDFHEKYTLKTSAIHVPARIDSETSTRIKQLAETIYKVLDCRGFARVDLFLSESGRILFNEVNTIPGFTTHSRFPGMLKAAGLTFEQIIDSVVETALER
ncbi:D-alanine--D-serine ligase VanG [bacterium C-53]|nr:D-alanine--D-serine ligase VanG [Lachnospiraceae bacterium]NBI04332.1 D-alanine--D-serine ligase VanG [Lachnospiraceae bacterium]RKJ08332.1 D-alanine--D-serine ligase VanG [bacterium C-53]